MRKIKPPLELGAGRRTLAGTPQRRAVVRERAGKLDRGLRPLEDLHSLGEQRQPVITALDQPLVPQRDPERTWATATAQISHDADGGWIISDTGRAPVRYDDRDIRISILWKAQVRPGPESGTAAPLRPETIIEIISADLTRRGVQAPGQVASLSDQGWLDLVHSAYYIPVSAATQ